MLTGRRRSKNAKNLRTSLVCSLMVKTFLGDAISSSMESDNKALPVIVRIRIVKADINLIVRESR